MNLILVITCMATHLSIELSICWLKSTNKGVEKSKFGKNEKQNYCFSKFQDSKGYDENS